MLSDIQLGAAGVGSSETGAVRFAPYFFAPLSGISDGPCRRIARELGVPMVVSEMIASEAVLAEHKDASKLPDWQTESRPLMVQLAGTEPDVIARAAAMVEARGADIIDLNFGCPARRVVKKASGSALMREPELCEAIFRAVVTTVSIPVTVKMRLGWDDHLLTGVEIAQRAEQSGVQMLSVHGRTRCQFYQGAASPAAIRPIKTAVSVPVILNGDLNSPEKARADLKTSGADGVMFGRAAVGNPWLILRTQDDFLGREPSAPGRVEVAAVAKRHLNYLLADPRFLGRPHRYALQHFRKHLHGYVTVGGAQTSDIAQFMSITDPGPLIDSLELWAAGNSCA